MSQTVSCFLSSFWSHKNHLVDDPLSWWIVNLKNMSQNGNLPQNYGCQLPKKRKNHDPWQSCWWPFLVWGWKGPDLNHLDSNFSPQHPRSPGLPRLPARAWWNLPASTIPSARAPPYPPHVAAKDPGGRFSFHNGTIENSVPRCSIVWYIIPTVSLKFMVDVGKYYHTWSILWSNLSWIMFTPLNLL